jgi:hypothetical protein
MGRKPSGSISCTSGDTPSKVILRWLYRDQIPPKQPINHSAVKTKRNKEIVRRFNAGESARILAKEFRLSVKRTYFIIRRETGKS